MIIMRNSLLFVVILGILNLNLIGGSDPELNDEDKSDIPEIIVEEEEELPEDYVKQNVEIKKDRKKYVTFEPTEEWQRVPDNAAIPKGCCYIRLNLEKGYKEARLLKPEERNEKDTKENKDQQHDAAVQALTKAMSEVPEDPTINKETLDRVHKTFRSYKELKKEFEAMNMEIKTDLELLNDVLEKFRAGDSEAKLAALKDMEYLVHQYDNGREFVRAGGLKDVILPSLNASSALIKAEAIRLLGSAAQGNSNVQIAALEAGLIDKILRILSLDADEIVRARALYALSCIVRRFPYAQNQLMKIGGMTVFAELFDSETPDSRNLQLKVVTLLNDLVMEVTETEAELKTLSEDHPDYKNVFEKARQLNEVHVKTRIFEGGLCERLPLLLQASPKLRGDRRDDLSSAIAEERPVRPEHDVVEKVVTAMLALVDQCHNKFKQFAPIILDLEAWYQELATREEIERKANESGDHTRYYMDLAKKVSSLREKLAQIPKSWKDEL